MLQYVVMCGNLLPGAFSRTRRAAPARRPRPNYHYVCVNKSIISSMIRSITLCRYIYIERERDVHIRTYIHTYSYIYIYM